MAKACAVRRKPPPSNSLQFCFHSCAAQKTQDLLVLPTTGNTKHLDKYVKLLQTKSWLHRFGCPRHQALFAS